ncbi:cell division protein FtsL [Lactobacillus nasalidis]|uniref:Cell division protein FtsL n=1 Tax=Lactobacillus nasalidis TaxID=2797258 RepID=A0ABQ3W4J0_9LACO|nr:cell division protein FtsL [Lactobacillus nasalidis]GHV97111.1 cell division protein FtsL [Lactobacillus nasalidis]GHV99072.1 cell division protein FtsL [Lactobacillus nasalidis]GHW01331.1 cell division protein FtsL [Lactobacillus nasalidis]
MAGNTVRKYNYEPEEEARKSPRLVVDPQKVPYSAFEKILSVVGLLGAAALITLNISASVSATYAQRQLSEVKKSITKQKNATADLQQEIGELSSNTRLNKIAESQGLKLRESNIRTIR